MTWAEAGQFVTVAMLAAGLTAYIVWLTRRGPKV